MNHDVEFYPPLWGGDVFSNNCGEGRPSSNVVVIKDREDGFVDVWFENQDMGMTIFNGSAIKGVVSRKELIPKIIDDGSRKVYDFKTPFDQRFLPGTSCNAYVGGLKFTRENN